MFQYFRELSALWLLSLILLSKRSSSLDHRYEACRPTTCGSGPNISYPFYIPGQRESHCGHPDFKLSCSRGGFPLLHLPDSDYVVEDILYENKSLRLYNAAVSSPEISNSTCPRISNTSLPLSHFAYADNVIRLYLFSDCLIKLDGNVPYSTLEVSCDSEDSIYLWRKAVFKFDCRLTELLESCARHVIAPVEKQSYNDKNKSVNIVELIRRGFVVNWKDSICGQCEHSGGRCGYNASSSRFMCLCCDGPYDWSCPTTGKDHPSLILVLAGIVAILIAASFVILSLFAERKKMKNSLKYKDIETILQKHGNLAGRRYKYSEIKKMTKSFSEKLGKGGFGSVYKGKSPDGRLLAVKVLNESMNTAEEFINEVASISVTAHVNIVPLLGFCFEGSKRVLVYQFMPNGSLDRFIYSPSSSAETQLGWRKLLKIAVGVARGLEYLHRGCNTRIVHLDIKPHNILLDKDFQPKISDFGLAKLCPDRASIISVSGTRGTIGFIAPEVFCRNFGEVSHKSDIYSYGRMILEIIGGNKNVNYGPYDSTSEVYFPQWIYEDLEQSKDQEIQIVEEDEDQVARKKLAIVGLWCIQMNPTDRPGMSRVIEMLEGRLGSLQLPPKPYFSSSPPSAPSSSVSES